MTTCCASSKSNNTFKKPNRRVLILLIFSILAALSFFFAFEEIENSNDNHPQHSLINHNHGDDAGESFSIADRITCLNSPFSFDEDEEDAFHQAVMIKGAMYRRIVKPSGLVLIQFALLPHCTTKNNHNEKKSDDISVSLHHADNDDDGNNDDDEDEDEISLEKIKNFLKTCGWNPNMREKIHVRHENNEQVVDDHDERFSKMNSAGNFKTNSQLLIPVSRKKFYLRAGGNDDNNNDGKSEKCFSVPSPKSNQRQKVVNVDVLYRRQFGFHMYHSIVGPFGLFQLWLLKNEVIKKLGKLINPSAVHFNYRVIYDEGEDPEKEKKSRGNPLAKIFYELVLGEIPDDSLLSMKTTTTKTADILVYGGFAHQVAIGKLFDDTPLKVSTELRLQMRNFASVLRSGATRKLSMRVSQKNQKIPSTSIFKENRPFCFENSLDQFPRFRGIRKQLLEQEMIFNYNNDTNSKIFEYGGKTNNEDTSWLQIEHALTSKFFVFSEGAGVIQQLLAPPNATIFVIFDNSYAPLQFPFLRRAAYHTKISAALGLHRMIFVTLLSFSAPKEVRMNRSNGIVAASSLENIEDSSIGFIEQDQLNLFRKEWKNAFKGASGVTGDNNFNFKSELVFVGSTPVFPKSNGVMMNPNGRQPLNFYFENNARRNKNNDGDDVKGVMKC